jgi:hypothetical protein
MRVRLLLLAGALTVAISGCSDTLGLGPGTLSTARFPSGWFAPGRQTVPAVYPSVDTSTDPACGLVPVQDWQAITGQRVTETAGVTVGQAAACMRGSVGSSRPIVVVLCVVRPMTADQFTAQAYFGTACGLGPATQGRFANPVAAPTIGSQNAAWQSTSASTWVAFRKGDAVVDVWLTDYGTPSPALDLQTATRLARDAATRL